MKELNSYKNKLRLIHTRNLQRKFSQMHLIAYYCQNCEQGGLWKILKYRTLLINHPPLLYHYYLFQLLKSRAFKFD